MVAGLNGSLAVASAPPDADPATADAAANASEAQLYFLAIRAALGTGNLYMLVVIVVVGLCGNAFAVFVIWTSPALRRVSSNHYLMALALSDSVFLLGLALIWMNKLGAPTYHRNVFFCKLVLYLLNSSGCLSAWYTTALTVERFVVVYYPLARRAICSIGRTRVVVVSLLPVPAMFNIWILLLAGIDENGVCDIPPEYYEHNQKLNGVDMALSFVLPVLIILCFNTAICVKLWLNNGNKVFGKKRGATADAKAAEADMRKHTGGANAKVQRQERKITQTLLIITFVFVALNLPSYSVRLRDSYLAAVHDEPAPFDVNAMIIGNVFLLIYYTNFALNFIVYCVSSKNFRAAVKDLWVRRGRRSMPATGHSYLSADARTSTVDRPAGGKPTVADRCPHLVENRPQLLTGLPVQMTSQSPEADLLLNEHSSSTVIL